jgi:hypothetical protein
MSEASAQSLLIPVLRWHYWEGSPSELPELKSVEPLLRRRLSPQGRAALAVADIVAGGLHPVRVVYASQHGELARTLGIMESLRPESPDGPSPASFALSVLNSTPGIYSIARRDHSPALALSAGEASCWYGLLEAAQVWIEHRAPVLLISADAPVPTLFRRGQVDPAPVRALAVLIGEGGAEHRLIRSSSQSGDETAALPALASALEREGGWSREGSSWRLSRHA